MALKEPPKRSLEYWAAQRQQKTEFKALGAIFVLVLLVSGVVIGVNALGKPGGQVELVYSDEEE